MKKTLLLCSLSWCLLALTGCNETPPQTIDAPQLASALKWLGVCGVLCSLCGALGLIIASRNRRK